METLIICATHIFSSRRKRLPAHTQKFRRKAAPRRRSLGQGECGLEYANKTNCEQSTSFANPQKESNRYWVFWRREDLFKGVSSRLRARTMNLSLSSSPYSSASKSNVSQRRWRWW